MEKLEVRGSPNDYVCEKGILSEIPDFLKKHKLNAPLVVHGEKSWEAAQSFLSFPITFQFAKYQGECSPQEIKRISNLLTSKKCDCVIGIGGGKVLDLVKASGNENDLPVILIPTLAATCAAWTPLSVIYDNRGKFLHYTIYKNNSLAVFIEPNILLHSPTAFLRAGIGDTLAKWYEAEAIINQEDFLTLPMQIALKAAEICKNNLLANGTKALADIERSFLSKELISTFETIIMAGGMVGGFGDRYGRIAGAHSVHNALTYLPETHFLLHGEKVAYGILIQLALEKNFPELQNLITFYRKLQLPYCLNLLGITEVEKAAETIAYYSTLPNESIHLLEQEVTSQKVKNVIFDLEEFVTKFLGNDHDKQHCE